MKRMIPLVICGLVSGAPALACTAPTAPAAPAAVPDGKSSTKDAMLAAKREVDKYKEDAEAYMSCESNARKVELVQADLERVANQFNAAVRAFKAANAT